MSDAWVENIKAVGFDLDGTLYHSPGNLQGWFKQEVIKRVVKYLKKDQKEVEQEYARRYRKYKSNTLTLNSFGMNGEEVFQALFDEVDLSKYVGRDEELIRLVKDLGKKYQLFILSNGAMRQIVKKLTMLGLDLDMFDPIVACYEHVGWVKPSPKGFLHVIDYLGRTPEQIVYVGDREMTDIQGASAVGMRTVMVWGESKKADVSIPTVYDLEQVLL